MLFEITTSFYVKTFVALSNGLTVAIAKENGKYTGIVYKSTGTDCIFCYFKSFDIMMRSEMNQFEIISHQEATQRFDVMTEVTDLNLYIRRCQWSLSGITLLYT